MVADLTDKIKAAAAGVVVDYKGINVADDTKLRKELREAGVHYATKKLQQPKRISSAGRKQPFTSLQHLLSLDSFHSIAYLFRIFGKILLEPVFIIRGCRMGEGFCCPARRKNADNTLCIARFFNAAVRQKARSDGGVLSRRREMFVSPSFRHLG